MNRNYYQSMVYTEFEYLLRRNLSVAKEVIRVDFKKISSKKSNFKVELYGSHGFFDKNFYGMSYNYMSIQTDKSNNIESISVHFRQVIDLQLYNSLKQKYGEPDNILIIENRKTISDGILKDENGKITQNLRKGEFDLREGSFEESPLYIIWKKESYNIKAFIRHKQNISEIKFMLPTQRL